MSSPTTEIDTPKLLSLFKTNYEKRKLYYEDLFERFIKKDEEDRFYGKYGLQSSDSEEEDGAPAKKRHKRDLIVWDSDSDDDDDDVLVDNDDNCTDYTEEDVIYLETLLRPLKSEKSSPPPPQTTTKKELDTTSQKSPTTTKTQNCLVCDDVGHGIHCGVVTCESCFKFFTRTIGKAITKCKNEGKCIVDKTTRVQCKSCRFQKCILIGMVKEEKEKIELQLCMVCGEDKTKNKYYGAIVCGACRLFFSTAKDDYPVCTKQCVAVRKCARCRYDKCISLGMAK